MRFVHLSDLHYRQSERGDIQIVLSGLEKSLREKGQVDLAFFTGDLAYSGDSAEDFRVAGEMLLNCLEKGSGLPKERLILCAGNHDVSQKLFKDDLFLDNALKDALSTSSSTNQFLDKRESGHYIDLSLRPLSNYLNFESSLSEGLILNPHKLLRSRVVCIDDRNVRICGFNSAWRSTGGYGDDLKRLVIGERVVDLALEQNSVSRSEDRRCTPPAGVVIRERSRSDRGSHFPKL